MANKKYVKGRKGEYEFMKLLEKQGYSAYRTAGSHSLFDVIGMNEHGGVLCQTKRNCKPTSAEIEKFNAFKNYPTNFRKEMWIRMDREDWRQCDTN